MKIRGVILEAVENARGLKDNERAFRTPIRGGEEEILVAVEVRRGPEDDNDVRLVGTAREITEEGETARVQGSPLSVPLRVHAVSKGSLADGRHTIEQILADLTEEMVSRVRNAHVAIEAWARIPAADDHEEGDQ